MNELKDLLLRGMRGFFPATDAEIIREVACGMREGRYKVFTVHYTAFVIIVLPQNPLQVPQVVHFYSEGAPQRRALVAKVLAFMKENGYNKFWGINGSGKSDAVWTRAFRHKEWKINAMNTVFEFEVMK